MNQYRCIVLGVVKHAYVPHGVAAHPAFELTVVADHDAMPDWVHARNQEFADSYKIPYVRDVQEALRSFDGEVAVVTPEAERHCELSVLAAEAGLHIVQDKPMSNRLAECDRLVEAVMRNQVKFLMWNRNRLPALVHAGELIQAGRLGEPYAIHVDFYFAKDCGPPKGSRRPEDAPIDWLEHQIAAHRDGSDGGVGKEPMGELKIEGIYPLGYIHHLTKARPRRVFAHTQAHFHQLQADNDVEDLATLSLELERGIQASLCIGRIGAASHPDIGEIKIHMLGSEGGLVISEARPEVAVYYRGQPPQEFRHQRIANENDFLLMEDFAEAIEQDRETTLDVQTSRAIAATVEAALESARLGEVIDVAHLDL